MYGFKIYFTPLIGVLFIFPSRYLFTIGQLVVFCLGGWSPQIQTRFHVPRPTQDTLQIANISDTGPSPSLVGLPRPFSYICFSLWESYNPEKHAFRFGLFQFRSPLLPESRLITLPSGTKMFQFPEFALSYLLYSVRSFWPFNQKGFPIRTLPDRYLFVDSPRHFAD